MHDWTLHPTIAKVPSVTVRSAAAGDRSDAALARVCGAVPSATLSLGVRG